VNVLSLDIADDRLSRSLIATFADACDRVEDSGDAPVVITCLRGSPTPAEVASADELDIHFVNKWERTLRRFERLGAATVALAEGVCSGPALEVLLCTDYRIATPESSLRFEPAAGATWPGMLVHRLAHQIGTGHARRLVLFGGEISIGRACELGLVDDTATDLLAAARLMIKRMVHLEPSELAVRRRLLLDAETTSFDESLGTHLAACERTLRRRSAVDGAAAGAH
jgi:isomerase DpgB